MKIKASLNKPSSEFNSGVSFDDVLIEPAYSEITSRQSISISNSLDSSLSFQVPIISSPMDTVTESTMATAVSSSGGLGIIHRYNTIDRQVHLVRTSIDQGALYVGAAIGVKGDYIERAVELVSNGVAVLCVDIAHGHHVLMKNALANLRNVLGSEVHIMAGNVATPEAFSDLASWGASSVRVGIGGGSICSTRLKTGHGVPTLQSIFNISCRNTKMLPSPSYGKIPLIADGGIKTAGDIVKALAAGADFVMLGSMLSGSPETPGDILTIPDPENKTLTSYKVYRGMSSVEAQMDWRGHTSSLEGVSAFVKTKPSISTIIKELANDIRSGLSYSGANTILELQEKASFLSQTSFGVRESGTHINTLNDSL